MRIKINGYWKEDKAKFKGKIIHIVPAGTDIDIEKENEDDEIFFTVETTETEEDKIVQSFILEYGEKSKEDWVVTKATHILVENL